MAKNKPRLNRAIELQEKHESEALNENESTMNKAKLISLSRGQFN